MITVSISDGWTDANGLGAAREARLRTFRGSGLGCRCRQPTALYVRLIPGCTSGDIREIIRQQIARR